MRVNVYAEEMTDKVELITKTTPDGDFTGIRFYLELPVTEFLTKQESGINKSNLNQISGPFIHHPGDDDSAAVTFWGKHKLKVMLQKALELLEENELNLHRS